MTTPKPLSPSPLALEKHQFCEIRVTASKEDDPQGAFSLRTSRKLAPHNEDALRFVLELGVEIGTSDPDDPAPHEARLSIQGFFKVNGSYPEGRVNELVEVTGASMLYGACREMLISLTARGPHGIVSLPSVSFIEPKEQPAKKKSATSKKKTATRRIAKK